MKPSFSVKCPNHGVDLVDLPWPMPEKGTGICPISGCPFDFNVDIDPTVEVMDKFGNKSKQLKWNVTGDEK